MLEDVETEERSSPVPVVMKDKFDGQRSVRICDGDQREWRKRRMTYPIRQVGLGSR